MRKLKINTQERALSTDLNRLQDFKERDTLEILRLLLLSRGSWEAGGEGSNPLVPGLPAEAEILQGLLVRPQAGTLALTVDTGSVILMGEARVDGSPAYYVQDAGVPVTAPLAVTSNVTVSPRVDVVECKVDSVPLQVGESRDVYDPVTDTFQAALVVKEEQRRLQYRVRAGSAGNGFPGLAAGWVPLAVVLIPPATATLDACTLWDVRPMIADRVNLGPNNTHSTFGDGLWLDLEGRYATVGGNVRVAHNGRWLGGELRRGSPGTDALTMDFGDAANGVTGGGTFGVLWTMYLCLPFGLPRWMRYTDAGAGARVPRGCRGIPILSTTVPKANGLPLVPLVMPSAFGFLSTQTVSDARSVLHGFNSTNNAANQVIHAHGRRIRLSVGVGVPADASPAPNSSSSFYTLITDVHYPRTAKKLAVTMGANFLTNTLVVSTVNVQLVSSSVPGGFAYDMAVSSTRTEFAPQTTPTGFALRVNGQLPVQGVRENESVAPANQLVQWSTGIVNTSVNPTFTSGNVTSQEWEL
jgi:hypothetical protein